MIRLTPVLAFAAAICVQAHGGALQPRRPLPKAAAVGQPAYDHQLVVKFMDHLRVRGEGPTLVSRTGGDLERVHAIAKIHGVTFRPLIRLPRQTLDRLEQRAARASGMAQPDLGGMFIADAPHDRLQAVADALLTLDLTEFVHFQQLAPQPPCIDIAPATPSYVNQQDYRGADPGLNMDAAWLEGSARGLGIKLADCEYGYRADHEDLCGITMEPGQTISQGVFDLGWEEHGTAVLGEMVSADNGYGCLGMVPDADTYFFTEWSEEEGFRRATAVTNAIAGVDSGDVVVLEMQTTGAGGGFGPAELDPAIWTITKNGTDAGVIVVAAAGNGNQDLDGPDYLEYRDRGDSGAIIVGAGSANINHSTLSFSTFGERVNLHGWGEFVFSTGYGDWAEHGGDPNQRYTGFFSGTSSATPLVASAVVAVQSYVEDRHGYRLLPLEMRDVLVGTGIPQGAGGHIGPLPNVLAAIDSIAPGNDDCAEATLILAGASTGFTTDGATTDGFAETICASVGGQIENDVWYRFFALCDGVVTLTFTDLDYDARVAVYAGLACPGGPDEAIACLDTTQSLTLDVPVTLGQALRFRVGGTAGAMGNGTFTADCNNCAEDCATPADGNIDIIDLLALLSQWGRTGSCDTTGGVVDISDLLSMLGAWGDCAP